MAPSRTQKKATPAAKKPVKAAAKPASRKPAAKAAPAKKPAAKAAKTTKPTAKKAAPAAKSAPKAAGVAKGKTQPVAKVAKPSRPAKPAAASKPVAAPKAAAPAPAPRRAVAASHRPQASAVAVQPRAARKTDAKTPSAERSTGALTEDSIRRASDAEYMSEQQLAFFTERLLQMRNEVLTREIDVKERLHQREVFADPADRASAEEEHWLDLRLRERESLLLKKIDEALRRIRDREYGYCEKTGEPIGIARLLARPTATVCVDVKGQDERAESQFRDR